MGKATVHGGCCAVLLCVLAAAGCATIAKNPPTLPERYRVVREQLIVHSDFPLATRHRLIEELIARRYDLSEQLGLPLSNEPIHIYVFGDADRPRLTVFRSHKNMYCQLVDDFRKVTLAAASTREKKIVGSTTGFAGNCAAAAVVGKEIAERAKSLGVTKVRFARNGYRYHGRVKALGEAVRESGIEF